MIEFSNNSGGTNSSSECKMKEDARIQSSVRSISTWISELKGRLRSQKQKSQESFEHNQERNRKEMGMKEIPKVI